jgi:hypothetical protein
MKFIIIIIIIIIILVSTLFLFGVMTHEQP